MAGFFDRFFKKSEVKEERRLVFNEIPGYLESMDKDVGARIEEAANEARASAATGIKEIGDKIQKLEKTCTDDVKHPNPKVKQTAMKSKKNFITSMEKTLSTELPEDPDQLYTALVELIRSFGNTMRRQGKYLHPAFPDEMKDLKSSIDIIGRALNSMTEDFKPSVELREKVNRSKAYFEKISAAAGEIKTIDENARTFGEKTESLERSIADLETKRKEIISSGDYQEYESVVKELGSLKEGKSELSGRYGSFLINCDNVLRKTAYIAEKNGDARISENINYLVMLLHSSEKRDSTEASQIYRELYPYISTAISDNETIVKTKHEAHLFSSANLFISQLDEICGAYFGILSEIDSAEERLTVLGMNDKIVQIDRRVRDIEDEMEKINNDLGAGQSRKESLENSVPEIIENLKDLLSDIEGSEVVIEGDWRESVLT